MLQCSKSAGLCLGTRRLAFGDTMDKSNKILFESVIATQQEPLQLWNKADPSTEADLSPQHRPGTAAARGEGRLARAARSFRDP